MFWQTVDLAPTVQVRLRRFRTYPFAREELLRHELPTVPKPLLQGLFENQGLRDLMLNRPFGEINVRFPK